MSSMLRKHSGKLGFALKKELKVEEVEKTSKQQCRVMQGCEGSIAGDRGAESSEAHLGETNADSSN